MGRPSKLTPERQAAIVEHVAAGAPLATAAQAEGVTGRSANTWLARGWDGEEPYAEFRLAVRQAQARYEMAILKRLNNLDGADPKTANAVTKALTWLLERTRRDRYGAQITVRVAEAKEHLLDTVERVCDRMGAGQVCVGILEELAGSGSSASGADSGTGDGAGD
jgi:hypothetical protein